MSAFYSNPRLSVLLVVFVLLFGGTALLGLARQEDPTMTERWASVTTYLPGATAARVESLVTEPIETRLREMALDLPALAALFAEWQEVQRA